MPVSLRSAQGEGREEAMVSVTINEQTLEVEPGSTVLQAAERLGIDIPTFCYLKRLPALASCRMCLVEVEGQRRLQPSCATAVTDGMVVRTNTPLIDETRSSMLDMLLANHPLDCPICDKGGECELQDHGDGVRAPRKPVPRCQTCVPLQGHPSQPGHRHERQSLHPVPALRPDVRGGRRRGRLGHSRKRHGYRRHRLRGQSRELRPVRQLRRGLPGRRADELPLSLQGAALGSRRDRHGLPALRHRLPADRRRAQGRVHAGPLEVGARCQPRNALRAGALRPRLRRGPRPDQAADDPS